MSSLSQPSPLLTVEQVALRLSVTTDTVRKMLRAGALRGVKVGPGGRAWRVRPEDLEQYLANPPGAPASARRPRTGDRT